MNTYLRHLAEDAVINERTLNGGLDFWALVNSSAIYTGSIQCDYAYNYWGTIHQHNSTDVYSFTITRGADAVLKKLDSVPADSLIKAINTTYKAVEEEDMLVIWEHSGRCRTQNHPAPHSTFTIIAAGVTKVNSVLKGQGGDYRYSANGNYFVQHLSVGQTISCSLSEDDFETRYKMYVIKA